QGQVLWQRQLGLVCQGDPLLLRPDPKEPPVVLALDQGGGLFTLDPTHFAQQSRSQWLSDSQRVLLAKSLVDNPRNPPVLLPGPDGQSAYEIATPGPGRNLVIRHVTFEARRTPVVAEQTVQLPAPLGGPPALVGARLVLPLADGTLRRLPLPLPTPPAD